MNDNAELSICWCGHSELRHSDHDCHDCPEDTARKLNHVMGWFVDDALRVRYEEARASLYKLSEQVAAGDASDGYHTHNELYDYRMLYNAHAAHGWLAAGIPVVKSWRHHDGEPCFGGGWFIVVATLPTGQVSNHYAAEYWGLFDVPEVELPPEYDGHTPAEAAERLRAALTADQRMTLREILGLEGSDEH